MTLLVDTRVVAAPERAGFWANEIKDAYHPVRVQIDRREGFQGRIWGESLASVRIFRIAASAHFMCRTRADIVAGDPESVYISLLLRGRLRGSQHGREFFLEPGDLTAHDSSHPATRWSDESFDVLVAQVPKSLLGAHAARLERRTAVRIPGGAGLPKLAGRFLCGTAAGLADGSIAADDSSVAELVCELVRRLYDGVEVAPGERPRSRAEILSRATAYIEAHLGDPELDPEQIARACFISKRHLYGVFSASGRTVCESIRAVRLDRCRRDLLDPSLGDEPISSIATRHGLPNAPHFSRLFRAEYGCSPRDLRREATSLLAVSGDGFPAVAL